jgi:electron transfer flavoprotein alpha subunit
MKPLRIAALVKQIPRFEVMQLGPDGRLQRDGVELSMNPYCLRAVSQGVALAHQVVLQDG